MKILINKLRALALETQFVRRMREIPLELNAEEQARVEDWKTVSPALKLPEKGKKPSGICRRSRRS